MLCRPRQEARAEIIEYLREACGVSNNGGGFVCASIIVIMLFSCLPALLLR